MTCRLVKALLPLYVSLDLSPCLNKRIEAHLARCPRCQKELKAFGAALKTIKEAAQQGETLEWRAASWSSLLNQINQEETPRKPSATLKRRWALASSLAVILIGFIAFSIYKGKIALPWATLTSRATPFIAHEQPIDAGPKKELSKKETQEKMTMLLGENKGRPELRRARGKAKPLKAAPESKGTNLLPDSLTINLVSQESGLEITLVLNRNFDWKGVVK